MIFVLNKDFKVILTLRIDETNKSDTRYFNDIYNGNLETGTATFKFSTPLNHKTGEAIVGNNYIIYKDDNNKFKLFQIMITEQTSNLTPSINVYCESAGMDLLYEPFRARKINPCTIRQFLNTVLSETTWEIGYIEDSLIDVITISDIDSDINIFKLIQQEISKFNCDIEFAIEFKNRYLKKYVNVYKRKGKLYKTRLEVQKNTDEIIKTLDFTNVATALIGRGKDGLKFTDIEIEGIEKPIGQDFIYDIEAFERYNINGRHLFKFFDYDTSSPYELLRKTNEALQTYSKPCAKYDVKADLFSSLSNEDFYKLEEGDTFYITDYNFVPPLFLEARVSEITKSKYNKSDNKVVFSNYKEIKSKINNLKMNGRQIIKAINDSYSETKLDGRCIEEKTISGDKIVGGVIEGTELKTSEPHSNGGMWIRDNGMQLGQTAFIYDPSGRFAISSKDDIVISNGSGKNIYLIPSEYVSINGDCTAKSFKIGSGKDAFFNYGIWYSQFAGRNLYTYGIKLNFLNLIGTDSGNLHVTNGNGSPGGLYANFMNSYNITTECDIDSDNNYSALELINNAIVKQNKIIPKTTTFSDNKLDDYLKITEDEKVETSITNIVPLLWKSIQELIEEINTLKGVDSLG